MKHALRILLRIKLHKFIPKKLSREARKRGLSPGAPSLLFDLENSLVIPLGYTIPFGALHVNPKLRSGSERILSNVVEALTNLEKNLREKLAITVWRKNELYWGDKINLLPDIVFTINDWSCVVIKDLRKNTVYLDAPYSPRHTGSHRLHGIFIAWGRDFKKCIQASKVSVLDIIPTILYMFEAPIPSNIDGKVLRELLKYGALREPNYVPPIHYRVKRIKQSLANSKHRQIKE